MPELLDDRRKRLLYRSRYTGTKETDLLLGGFAAAHLGTFDAAQLDQFELLLTEPDPQIFDWATGRAAVPPQHDNGVMRLLKNFKLVL
ncbi:MAG: succinate dehydrogenase assembly factor 2 [Proteobacteria bacterium]|nr:succinate dehydrogenase assembly factor 2 [Pseudomonadota bacterium]